MKLHVDCLLIAWCLMLVATPAWTAEDAAARGTKDPGANPSQYAVVANAIPVRELLQDAEKRIRVDVLVVPSGNPDWSTVQQRLKKSLIKVLKAQRVVKAVESVPASKEMLGMKDAQIAQQPLEDGADRVVIVRLFPGDDSPDTPMSTAGVSSTSSTAQDVNARTIHGQSAPRTCLWEHDDVPAAPIQSPRRSSTRFPHRHTPWPIAKSVLHSGCSQPARELVEVFF